MTSFSDHTLKVLEQLRGFDDPGSAPRGFPYDSWFRCVSDYGLSPDGRCEVPLVEQRELERAHEQIGENFALANEELDQLYPVIKASGYSITMSNNNCMIVAGRKHFGPSNPSCDERPGTIWNERFCGTNSIGTAIHDLRTTSLYQDEHFFVDHINESCVTIPLFAADGTVWASLGLSNKHPDVDRATHALAQKVLTASTERLSYEVFRREFRYQRILRLRSEYGQTLLLAVDDDFQIVGADRSARAMLELPLTMQPFSLWQRFAGSKAMFNDLANEPVATVAMTLLRDGSSVRGTVVGAFQRKLSPSSTRHSAPTRSRSDGALTMDDWAGNDPTMKEDVRSLRRLIGRQLPILLLGETGVGKDTLARAYHAESPRRQKPFVAVNCGAIPESLIESELFGYENGAFTGARKGGAPGRFKQADGGTLFLDEIGEMPLLLQTRLLRILETGELHPLGASQAQTVDVQVIAATNRDLEERVAAGLFRADLYYRLAGVVIQIPALRDRMDRTAVIDRMADGMAQAFGLDISAEARRALHRHGWPGNMRELALVLDRAACLAVDRIEWPDLRLPASTPMTAHSIRTEAGTYAPSHQDIAPQSSEHRDILNVMAATSGDAIRMAAQLGISRATLYRRLKKYGLTRPMTNA